MLNRPTASDHQQDQQNLKWLPLPPNQPQPLKPCYLLCNLGGSGLGVSVLRGPPPNWWVFLLVSHVSLQTTRLQAPSPNPWPQAAASRPTSRGRAGAAAVPRAAKIPPGALAPGD